VIPDTPITSLSDAPPEVIAALRLSRSDGIGPVTFHGLIGRFGSAIESLKAIEDRQLKPTGKRSISLASATDVEDELYRLNRLGGQLIGCGSRLYPQRLAEISDAPPFLTVFGDVDHLHKPSIAIVGARNAAANGRKMAGTLARELGSAGLTVWSGLGWHAESIPRPTPPLSKRRP